MGRATVPEAAPDCWEGGTSEPTMVIIVVNTQVPAFVLSWHPDGFVDARVWVEGFDVGAVAGFVVAGGNWVAVVLDGDADVWLLGAIREGLAEMMLERMLESHALPVGPGVVESCWALLMELRPAELDN